MSDRKNDRLGTESIWKLMFQLGIPSLVAQLINMLYNIVDRIYIGHIAEAGSYALTGVGLCMPIVTLLMAFSSLVGAGGAPLASIALGEGRQEKAQKYVGNSLFAILALSAVLTVTLMTFRKPILYAFGASDNTFRYANEYLSVYLLGTVFVMISLGLNVYITAQGQSKIAMLSVLIGALINIILDPILIFGLHMGVRGAAVATVFSQACSSVWILKFLLSEKSALRIRRKNLLPDRVTLLSMMGLGIAPFIMTSTESLISISFNRSLSLYGGDLYVGSITIMQSIMQMLAIPLQGFTSGVQPILSYNYGACNRSRCTAAIKRIAVVVVPYSFLFALAIMFRPRLFAGLFTTDAELLALAEQVMPVFFAGMLIFGIQNCCQCYFMAFGQAKFSLFFALLRKVILLIPMILIFPAVTGSVYSIYWAEPAADILSAATCGAVFLCFCGKILDKRMGTA